MFTLQTFKFGLSGVLFALSSLLPETWISLACGWGAVIGLAYGASRSRHLLSDFFIFGLVFHCLAFYWLPQTISFFGGFPAPAAFFLLAVFAAVSSLQFVIRGWLVKRLNSTFLAAAALPLALAWMLTEFLVPRMFPWALAHTQIRWTSFASLAAYSGVTPLSGLLLWWSSLLIELLFGMRRTGARRWVLPISIAFSFAALLAGYFHSRSVVVELSKAPTVRAALIQGNLDAAQKGDINYLAVNLERYQKLSLQAVSSGSQLLIWPESVFNVWLPEATEHLRSANDKPGGFPQYDPFPGLTTPLLFGGLSYRPLPADRLAQVVSEGAAGGGIVSEESKYSRFNTAFGIDAAGKVVGRYHKRVLMPFGEYLPFAARFPFIKKLSPHTGDFTVGELTQPISFRVAAVNRSEPVTFSAAVLICYEDLIPALSREAVEEGANILVNLTNDAWYGRTAAPYQHQLLAMWRAIETGRYLLRVTNTGYTAVINPLGETVSSLPIFTAGMLQPEVQLLSGRTVYSHIGDAPLWLLTVLIGALLMPGFFSFGPESRKDAIRNTAR